MAELVDALVSNTNEVTLVPVRLRLRVHKLPDVSLGAFFMKKLKKHLWLNQTPATEWKNCSKIPYF